jgi:hypothetical protein
VRLSVRLKEGIVPVGDAIPGSIQQHKLKIIESFTD